MNDAQNKLTPELVSIAISSGMLDASLEALGDIVRRRKDIIAAEKAARLLPGTEFLAVNISPKKLSGCTFRFLRFDGQWLECEWVNIWERPSNYRHVIKLRDSHVGTITKAVA